jgi:hypothetical protein
MLRFSRWIVFRISAMLFPFASTIIERLNEKSLRSNTDTVMPRFLDRPWPKIALYRKASLNMTCQMRKSWIIWQGLSNLTKSLFQPNIVFFAKNSIRSILCQHDFLICQIKRGFTVFLDTFETREMWAGENINGNFFFYASIMMKNRGNTVYTYVPKFYDLFLEF